MNKVDIICGNSYFSEHSMEVIGPTEAQVKAMKREQFWSDVKEFCLEAFLRMVFMAIATVPLFIMARMILK